MAELDNIPQTQAIEIATVKMEEATFEQIKNFNAVAARIVSSIGEMYLRKQQIADELEKLEEGLVQAQADFKQNDSKLGELLESLDEKYPQGRVNMADGSIQYQPGALTRKQIAEQQVAAQQSNEFKVVKE
jgi:uncharacterized membrane-anchored protein YhcB (DUF1043 family)